MHSTSANLPLQLRAPQSESVALELRGFTYDDRQTLLPVLFKAMAGCGCWLRERKAASVTQVDLHFEVQLRSVVELYSALIGAGLELSRASHSSLTGHCNLRKHNLLPTEVGRVLAVKLELNFVDDDDLPTMLTLGTAVA